MEYKGYEAVVRFSDEDKIFYGEVLGVNDLVSFEGDSVEKLEMDFHEAVDSYLDMCEANGLNPNKPYKGSFNVRISSDLHKKISFLAEKNGNSLNMEVAKAIEEHVEAVPKVTAITISLDSLFRPNSIPVIDDFRNNPKAIIFNKEAN